MSYSRNSLKGDIEGNKYGTTIGLIKEVGVKTIARAVRRQTHRGWNTSCTQAGVQQGRPFCSKNPER